MGSRSCPTSSWPSLGRTTLRMGSRSKGSSRRSTARRPSATGSSARSASSGRGRAPSCSPTTSGHTTSPAALDSRSWPSWRFARLPCKGPRRTALRVEAVRLPWRSSVPSAPWQVPSLTGPSPVFLTLCHGLAARRRCRRSRRSHRALGRPFLWRTRPHSLSIHWRRHRCCPRVTVAPMQGSAHAPAPLRCLGPCCPSQVWRIRLGRQRHQARPWRRLSTCPLRPAAARSCPRRAPSGKPSWRETCGGWRNSQCVAP
mmetsp:Transcript_44627/g.139839  ORF Transcript_44627/g.139839 Transcript_44627/m.139839 type:complete len:257 (-) Transcript_44627:1258-2028(-)